MLLRITDAGDSGRIFLVSKQRDFIAISKAKTPMLTMRWQLSRARWLGLHSPHCPNHSVRNFSQFNGLNETKHYFEGEKELESSGKNQRLLELTTKLQSPLCGVFQIGSWRELGDFSVRNDKGQLLWILSCRKCDVSSLQNSLKMGNRVFIMLNQEEESVSVLQEEGS